MGSWGTVRVDSGELAYQHSEGQGHPVVFVHGNSSSARTWQTLLDGPFGTRFRCLAIDLPGHGRSPFHSWAGGLCGAGLQRGAGRVRQGHGSSVTR